MVRGHFFRTLAQEGNVFLAPDKAHMRRGINKLVGLRETSRLDQVAPELEGYFEIGIDG